MMISCVFALTQKTIPTGLATGNININLNTYELNKDFEEVIYGTENKIYLNGDDVSLIPKVQNIGDDCYIRIKIDYINSEFNSGDYINNMTSKFQLHDEFYYYEDVVKCDDIIKIFDGVKIPENINQKEIELTITAQAIQAKNFEPDFTLSDPWKGIQPVESSNTSYNLDSKDDAVTVVFKDGAENDVSIRNDFFKNISNILPGDVFEDIIEIKNKSKESAKYYLSYKSKGNEDELLEHLELIINNKAGKILYSGKIKDINNLQLGEYLYKEADQLNLKLIVPNDLENNLEKIIPQFDLIISAEYKDFKNIEEKNIIETIFENGGMILENLRNPFTGDSINLPIIIFLISAICLIIVMVLAYKQKEKEE